MVNKDSLRQLWFIVYLGFALSCNSQVFLMDILSDDLGEYPHQVYSDDEREYYELDKDDKFWIISIGGDDYVMDSQSVMGALCDNVYELFHDASIDLSTPLKRKLFEKTDTYNDWMDEFKKISCFLKENTLHAPLEGVFRYQHKYDIDKGRFEISCGYPEFPSIDNKYANFYVPKDLKSFFRSVGHNMSFYVYIKNELVALEMENTESYGKHPYEFLIRFFYNGTSHDEEKILRHIRGESERVVKTTYGVCFDIYDIILYKTSNHQVVWSMRQGDLSGFIE